MQFYIWSDSIDATLIQRTTRYISSERYRIWKSWFCKYLRQQNQSQQSQQMGMQMMQPQGGGWLGDYTFKLGMFWYVYCTIENNIFKMDAEFVLPCWSVDCNLKNGTWLVENGMKRGGFLSYVHLWRFLIACNLHHPYDVLHPGTERSIVPRYIYIYTLHIYIYIYVYIHTHILNDFYFYDSPAVSFNGQKEPSTMDSSLMAWIPNIPSHQNTLGGGFIMAVPGWGRPKGHGSWSGGGCH